VKPPGLFRLSFEQLLGFGRVELQEGDGDIKTADGGGVLALTGVLERLSRHLSAVFDLYSPFKLLPVRQLDYCYDFDYLNLSLKTQKKLLLFLFVWHHFFEPM